MELNYQTILGIITVLMVFYSYFQYTGDMLKGKTKPHLLSWIVFVLIGSVSVLIQYNDGAGPGVWGSAITTIAATIVMLLAFKYGEKNITKGDTVSFLLSLLSIGLYITLPDPTYSLYLICIILTLAFYPTFRKSYHKPNEETLVVYMFSVVRTLLAIFATAHLSFFTLTFPIYIVLINTSFIILVLYRKKALGIK